ncbi:bifunctional cytidylyltransferase/SDR family oxidoreductase [Salinibacterium sp. SWN1162]|uniref:bifunctional cytidylyltransferase/SDR family oxidoreductase n=1 Tax=Salinibacterium sp. SWN1162 TaxID=2792053 RepID=UPI0027DB7BB5|nr:bifunctional cytidylyltransferase/SDR family oxidoreductase [Salinibacterium sp. SWN1162]
MKTESELRTVMVILAGGIGVRAGLGMPKQLARIAGKTILQHTLEAVHSSPEIDEIIIMMEPDHLEAVETIRESGEFPKLTRVLAGGATRNDTSRKAIEALGDDDEVKVLFHDAVRPFVSHRILKDCVEALDTYKAVDVAIPSADTIIKVAGSGRKIRKIPPRDRLRRGQTPQGFLLSTIREAYDRAVLDPEFAASDDCSVVLKYSPKVPIAVVLGEEENMKVTAGIDIFIADKLFQLRSADHSSLDAAEREEQLSGKTMVVFGGSAGIGRGIVEAAESFGVNVVSLSRSTTGTAVEDRESVAAALAAAHAESGRIDYVVNTAGVLELGSLEQFSPEQVRNILDVNLLGPVIIAQESLKYLRETSGQLLFFTSSSYTRGRANYGMYSATKAATVNLTQSLSEEWTDYGVRVNCINPERTKTQMRLDAFGEEPEGSLLEPMQVANASIDVLLGDLTGQVINVRRHSA